MILEKIKTQECDRWYLDEVLYDRLVCRTNFVGDPFASIEFVLKKGDSNKAFVLYKSEANMSGTEMFFQKEISVEKYLSMAVGMSEMFFDYIL